MEESDGGIFAHSKLGNI